MHVDPELLAHMSEDDRQNLFHKMRVEQVRRWEAWQEKLEEEDKARKKPRLPPKPGAKKVQFLMAADGNPWTWVIDDVKNDWSDDEEVTASNKKGPSVHSLVERLDGVTIKSPSTKRKPSTPLDVHLNRQKSENEEAEDLEVQAALTRAKKLAQMWEKREEVEREKQKADWLKKKQIIKENQKQEMSRSTLSNGKSETMPEVKEVYALLHNTQKNATELQNSIRRSIEGEASLKEQEKTDPETVKQIQKIARKAREEIEEISSQSAAVANKNQRNLFGTGSRRETLPITRTKDRPGRPPSRDAIIEWFRSEEKPRGAGLIGTSSHKIAPWFHGLINRQEAEDLLSCQEVGTFLVRFCERIWGYAISYRAEDKCRHYIIDASNGHYQFFGTNSMKFCKLSDLIRYYQVQSITPAGDDVLLRPCPNSNATIIQQLFL